MNIAFVRGRVDLEDGFEDHVDSRLALALDRFEDRVVSVMVRVDDVNGPRGGADKLCRVLIRMRGLPEIFVEDRESDAYACVDGAAHRALAAVTRAIERQRDQHGHARHEQEFRSTAER